MPEIREEIYDNNGLVEVRYVNFDLPTLSVEEQIAQKQEQLLQIYAEIQQLQSGSL